MLKLSQITVLLLGFALLTGGSVYLGTGEFKPYHSEAIGVNWNELDPGYQGLFQGFLRGLGAGTLTVGLVLSCMAVMMLRSSIQPYLILLPVVSISYLALLCFAAYTGYSKTPATPPLVPQLIMLGLAGVATLLLWIGWRVGNHSIGSR